MKKFLTSFYIEKKYIKDDNSAKGYLVVDSLKYELELINDEQESTDLTFNMIKKVV